MFAIFLNHVSPAQDIQVQCPGKVRVLCICAIYTILYIYIYNICIIYETADRLQLEHSVKAGHKEVGPEIKDLWEGPTWANLKEHSPENLTLGVTTHGFLADSCCHLSGAELQDDRLTLNRPKALNALSDGLMSALFQRLQEAPATGFDPNCRPRHSPNTFGLT